MGITPADNLLTRLTDEPIPFLALGQPRRTHDMDGDEFWSKFRLLERLSAGDVTTYVTQDPSGARVMAHFLRGRPGQTRELLARLDALTEARRSTIRQTLEVNGFPVFITDFIEPFDTFESWIASEAPSARPIAFVEPRRGVAEEPGPAEEASEEQAPGEFTRLFLTKRESREGPAEAPPAPDPAPPPPADVDVHPTEEAVTAGEESRGPGEFTQIFGPEERSRTPKAKPPPTPPPPPPSEPPKRAPSPAEPGEFTRMFGRPSAGETDALAGRRERDSSEREWKIEDPDSYLRRLGGSASAEPSPKAVPPARESAPPLAEPSPPPMPRGPSAYTRVVMGAADPAVAPPPPRPAPPPLAPEPKARRSNWQYLLIGVAILIAIVLLFLFFASRGARDGTPDDEAAAVEATTEEVVNPPEGEG